MNTLESSRQQEAAAFEADIRAQAELMLDSGVHRQYVTPKRFIGMNLATFPLGQEHKVTEAVAAIKSGNGVFISGPCGSGKTGLACSLRIEWAKTKLQIRVARRDLGFEAEDVFLGNQSERYRTEFLPSSEFFLELKDAMDYHQPAGEILERLSSQTLLIIDDIGCEKISDWSRQMFYTLIDRRYRNMAQTIITSNLTLDKLAEQIDDRIASRIADSCAVIYLDKIDHRTKRK